MSLHIFHQLLDKATYMTIMLTSCLRAQQNITKTFKAVLSQDKTQLGQALAGHFLSVCSISITICHRQKSLWLESLKYGLVFLSLSMNNQPLVNVYIWLISNNINIVQGFIFLGLLNQQNHSLTYSLIYTHFPFYMYV